MSVCECACECVRMALVVSGPFELACLWHFMTLKCYVKQIPLANNELAVFSATLSAIEKAVLKTLESLGFDRRDSVAAVAYVTAQHKGRSLSADDLQSAAVQYILDKPSGAVASVSALCRTVRVCSCSQLRRASCVDDPAPWSCALHPPPPGGSCGRRRVPMHGAPVRAAT